jgi:hypothetical protein
MTHMLDAFKELGDGILSREYPSRSASEGGQDRITRGVIQKHHEEGVGMSASHCLREFKFVERI